MVVDNEENIPFYGTVESHIISQKVALKSGFYPVFAEVKIRKSTYDKDYILIKEESINKVIEVLENNNYNII